MATVGNNLVTSKLSGKLGDQIVFRTRGNQTYVGVAPSKRESEPTEGQIEHQKLFQEAIIYGKSINADPAIKAEYKESAIENQSAFNVAVADFMQAPHIDEIDISNYAGKKGDLIRIRAHDDFKVVQAFVSISNADSSLVEEGMAVRQSNGLDWIYTVSAVNNNIAGDKIVIRISDMPGNITTGEKTI
jgi:hypothetical protein